MPLPRIVITPGEPAGIGPDICLLICQQAWPAELIFIADPDLLDRRAKMLGLTVNIQLTDLNQTPCQHLPGTLKIIPVTLITEEICGQLDSRNASYVIKSLQMAAQLCLDKACQALVTAPVQKSIINDAGIAFSGHTEFFADYCGGYPVMMLACESLRVALVTTHLPLKEVSSALTASVLEKTIVTLEHDLRQTFSIAKPRIAVCGLNPHAGEGGHLGDEEINTIIPTLNKLRKQQLVLTGPLPADTAFTPPVIQEHDAILAMYHDQGLPTLKYVGFGDAVNITLGLPIIRTSVDHGTALSLAGSGKATPTSLQSALLMAIELSTK